LQKDLIAIRLMAQDQTKEEPKGLFTSIFDGVKNAGSAVVDGATKVFCNLQCNVGLWSCNFH
jgi:hypothetical protein